MPLYEELTKCQPKTWTEVMRRVLAEVRLEEDRMNRDYNSPESEFSDAGKNKKRKERPEKPPRAESYSNAKKAPE